MKQTLKIVVITLNYHIELPITTGFEITITIGRYECQIVIVIKNYNSLTIPGRRMPNNKKICRSRGQNKKTNLFITQWVRHARAQPIKASKSLFTCFDLLSAPPGAVIYEIFCFVGTPSPFFFDLWVPLNDSQSYPLTGKPQPIRVRVKG